LIKKKFTHKATHWGGEKKAKYIKMERTLKKKKKKKTANKQIAEKSSETLNHRPDKHGPLEKGMANHFSVLALRTPGTV